MKTDQQGSAGRKLGGRAIRLVVIATAATLALYLAWGGTSSAQTLTLTASNMVLHAGDLVPPLAFRAAGYAAGDQWGQAVGSGVPELKTSVTSASRPGSYPVTIGMGSMKAAGRYTFRFVNGSITVLPAEPYGAELNKHPLYGPEFAINVRTQTMCPRVYGDGAHDDTAAILCLLTTNRSNPTAFYGNQEKLLYFPAGTYLLSDRLIWNGCAVTLWGDGPSRTIFRLAPNSAKYASAASPYDVIHFASTNKNQAFFNYAENLSIVVGPGNPGARALNFTGSNFDAIENVLIVSEDGQGVCGLCMPNEYPGPTMLKNVAVYGFDQGMAFSQNEYNVVAEGVTVQNQNVVGITSKSLALMFRKVFSYNTVTGFSVGNASNVLVNAKFLGGSPQKSAIEAGMANGQGTLYLRDIHISGDYASSLVDRGESPAVMLPLSSHGDIPEHWTGAPQKLFDTAAAVFVHLPVQETPEPVDDPDTSRWTALEPDIRTWPMQIAGSPSPSVYVPVLHNYASGAVDASADAKFTGVYKTTPGTDVEITVPDKVNHIAMNMMHEGTPKGTITFNVGGHSRTPLVIDHFASDVIIHHTGSRTLVVKHANFRYTCQDGAGDLFLEDVGQAITTYCRGQHVWARQLDDEESGQKVKPSSISLSAQILTMVVPADATPSLDIGSTILIVNLKSNNALNGSTAIITGKTQTSVTARLVDQRADIPVTPEVGGFFAVQTPKISCTACRLWVLGYKTEISNPALSITDGQAEILGGFHYPNRASSVDNAAVLLKDSTLFATMMNFSTNPFPNWVQETRGSTTRRLPNSRADGLLNVYYAVGLSPHQQERPSPTGRLRDNEKQPTVPH